MLSSRQLNYFLALAEDLHFSRAADRLHIAQSALSAQIKQLEDHLGIRLLDRGKRSAVSLTVAGRLFREEALVAQRQFRRAEQIAQMAARGQAGLIEIGYIGSAALNGFLVDALGQFRATSPDVQIRLGAMETPRQIQAIADGRLDIGLIRPRADYPAGIVTHAVHSETFLMAFPAGHPLADAASCDISALRHEAFVVPQFKESAGLQLHLDRLGERGGYAIDPRYRVSDFMTAISMVAAGYGVALVPASFAKLANERIVFREIADFCEQVELAVAYQPGVLTPSGRGLVEVMRRIGEVAADVGTSRATAQTIRACRGGSSM